MKQARVLEKAELRRVLDHIATRLLAIVQKRGYLIAA